MLNYVIYSSMGILSIALMVSFIRVRNVVKNGNPDRIRASLFLRYDVFKRTTLFVIDGMIFVFFVQLINMLFGLQYISIFYHQVMIIASLICLIVIGYSFVHLNQTVIFQNYSPARSELERWIYGDDRRWLVLLSFRLFLLLQPLIILVLILIIMPRSSAAVEEQTASMEEMAQSVQELSGIAENLQAIVARFKLNASVMSTNADTGADK